MIWLGFAIMVVSEAATLARIEPFWTWNTPFAWTGFILFADAIVFKARGRSWLRSAPGEFVGLALASIPLWLVFEFYNLSIDNWNYTGLPENVGLRLLGYGWSFATIWPAIFEGADLVAVINTRAPQPSALSPQPSALSPGLSGAIAIIGAGMLVCPFVLPPAAARYAAAPVWLGFVFLLDPINARLGAESLIEEARAGRFARIVNLSISGVLCGVLWEFWNYWSRGKWHYTVPIMGHLKIFEMPVPGYLGFPAFALECFTMYVFVRVLVGYGFSRTFLTAEARRAKVVSEYRIGI